MLRLVTSYFVWNLVVWMAIFFLSALSMAFFVNHWMKKNGAVRADCSEDPVVTLPNLKKNRFDLFLKETLVWWVECEQAQILLFAVLMLFFAIALVSASGGAKI